ncbi:MAG: hypothetical protein M1505_01035 [Patescibacteria group bacterium]|nr:hypothetical protein [Patescibacteria group bacterium]
MLIGAHLITSDAIALVLTDKPWIAFLIGVVSHHLFDALPHLDSNIFKEINQGDGANGKIKNWPIKFWLFFAADLIIGVFFLIYILNNFAQSFNQRLIVFWASFGAILPDLINFFFHEQLRQSSLGKIYFNFHKNFHWRFRSQPKTKQIVAVGLTQSLIIFLALILIIGLK